MLDEKGFKRKTYDDLLNDMSAKAKEYFGANANVSERAFLGILIRIMAWFLSLAWMAIEQVYHAGYRKSAEGTQLDKLLPLAGTTRNLAEYAYGEVTLTGTPNHTVESGFFIGTEHDVNFETITDVTLDENGQGTVEVVCTEIGIIGNVATGAINTIVNPDANVTSVTNLTKTSGGREKETDQEARERADITVEGQGSGTTASIRAELLKIPTVRAAKVVENFSDDTDQYDTPSRGLQTFVLGGSDEEIAQAILNKKAGGIHPYGTTYIEIPDISGEPQKIGFTRASEVQLFAKVTISTNTSFNTDGVDQVKNALVKYIGGADTNGQLFAGLNMNEKVVLAKGMAHVMGVSGVTDVEISFSTDGLTFMEENINIGVNEVAQINASNIEVLINV